MRHRHSQTESLIVNKRNRCRLTDPILSDMRVSNRVRVILERSGRGSNDIQRSESNRSGQQYTDDVPSWDQWIDPEWKSMLPKRIPTAIEDRSLTQVGSQVMVESSPGTVQNERPARHGDDARTRKAGWRSSIRQGSTSRCSRPILPL